MSARKGGLGRGLDALIPSTPLVESKSGVVVGSQTEIDINLIDPNSNPQLFAPLEIDINSLWVSDVCAHPNLLD